MSTEERLVHAFREALDVDAAQDVRSLTRSSLDLWDSLGQMQLVMAIEDEFEIELSTDDVVEIDSFERALSAVRSHDIE